MFLVRGYYHIRLTVCCVHLLDNGRIILLYLCVYHRCGIVGGSAARGLNVFVAEKTTIQTEIPIVCLYALRHDYTSLIGPIQDARLGHQTSTLLGVLLRSSARRLENVPLANDRISLHDHASDQSILGLEETRRFIHFFSDK